MARKKEDNLRSEARRLSIKEGSFSVVRQSLADSYITPFAIAINSSNFLIGLISSLTGLLGPISQWASSRLVEKYSRKKIVVMSVLYECLTWLPIIILGILYYFGIATNVLPGFLLLFFTLYIIVANIAGPAWFSWIGDIVDENSRGKWFANRNYILGLITLFFTLVAAFFLDYFSNKGQAILGFLILFTIGISARMIAREYFKKIYEPKLKLKDGYYFSFWHFLKKSPENNFGRYTLFRAMVMFSASVASPFFAVYMLRYLNFTYTTYMIIILSQSLFGLLIMRAWGKFADRYGNYTVMKITIFFISIYPFLWLVSPNPVYLILAPCLIGGIAWAGFNLAASNFIYDSVTPQKRGLVLSYYNVLSGIGIFLGAGLGSLIIKYVQVEFMETILLLFLISGTLRLLTGIIMAPYIKEVRETESFDSTKALKSLVPLRRITGLFEGSYEIIIGKNFRWKPPIK